MASSSNTTSLPPVLLNAWRLDRVEIPHISPQLTGWTVSSLAETHLKTQLKSYEMMLEEDQMQTHNNVKAPSLASLSAGKIIEMLEESDNLTADIRTIAKNLNPTTLREVLEDPRTPYSVLRAFLALPPGYGPSNAAETARTLVDVDEAILANEKYIRSRGAERNKDGKGLVNLDIASVLFGASSSGAVDGPLTITRKDPPKGGFEFLDEKRARTVRIQPSSKAFAETFNRITRNILQGLDWSNVFLAGGAALTTLMHTDPSEDDEVKDSDLDIYIYGLTPEEANEKVKHIYQVWKGNLPPDNKQQLVVKNSKTINLLADYPNRRIQIVLKLIRSPTQVLLNFDLDACALGFNGKEVLMLPRCARAIETGYSTFTMDLIWGHHLGDRRATQEIRVFKYADRGFGLRILPSYVRSLEQSESRQTSLAGMTTAQQNEAYPGTTDDEKSQETMRPLVAHRSWVKGYRDRKPDGVEPGLKTLKRIAYMGQNFVHGYYFGATPLSQCPDHERNDMESWRQEIEEAKAAKDKLFKENERRRAAGEACGGPVMSLNDLDTRDMHIGLPGGRRGLGGFELFMRHCEAWRLHARGDAILNPDTFSSTVYDPSGYDEVPNYKWDNKFSAIDFTRAIDEHNNNLFENLKQSVCEVLSINYQRTGWKDYLTRRIRRQVYGPDIDSVFEKQITMPVIVPYDLEQFLVQTISDALDEAGMSDGQSDKILIPVHEQGKGTAIIPDLYDTAGPRGNFRIWIVGNELMWAGIDRRIDEVFEILWALLHWHNSATANQYFVRLDEGDALVHLASSFRQRLPPRLDTSNNEADAPIQEAEKESKESTAAYARSAKWKGLTPREAVLFKRWAFHTPTMCNRSYNNYDRHMLFDDDEDMLYPFPDDLFWKDGDEGDNVCDGVPQWHDVDMEEEEHQDAQKEKEEGRKRKRENSDLSQDLVVPEI